MKKWFSQWRIYFSGVIIIIILSPLVFNWCLKSHDRLLDHHLVHNGLPAGYEEGRYEGMRYGLFVPPRYNKSGSYPLIVSLHGSGDTVSWNLGWYNDPVRSTDPCFVLTPKSLVRNTGWGTTWMPEHTPDMKKTLKVVDLIRKEYSINANRLYICGTSMGGFGVFSVLSKEPGMFAAAYSICGGGGSNIANDLVDTPLWIFHGSDDPVVPVSYSRDMYRAILQAGGYQVRYTEYPGVGHEAWEPAGKEPPLESWLLAQEKGVMHGTPDKVEDLRYEIVSRNHVKLSWNSPSDQANQNNQVWYYELFRNDKLIAEVDNTNTNYTDSTAAAGQTVYYQISTVNYFFKESDRTAELPVPVP